MKSYILPILMGAFLFTSCTKEDVHNPEQQPKLSTFKFTALQSNKSFSGSIELYPCVDGTFDYFGNYYDNSLTVITPSCAISKGAIVAWGFPLLLPLGTYNIIYWGISNATSYGASRSMAAPLRLHDNLSNSYWSMALNKDKKTYMPVWDQVMAVQSVVMGESDISIDLNRMVAGLNVLIKNSDGSAFDPSITLFEISVGGIAEKINYTTGAPINQNKTVKFALAINETRTSAQNAMVMLYPSAAEPTITIKVNLASKESRTYSTTLKNAFEANTSQTVTILTGDILSSDPGGSTFTIDNWKEEQQTIDAPIF